MEPLQNIPNLRLATKDDKQVIINIITKAFVYDAGLHWMLEDTQREDKFTILMDYLVDEILNRGFIYITKDAQGVALWATEKKEGLSFNLIKRSLNLALKLQFSTIIRLLTFQKVSHKQLPQKEKFLYLVNLAVHPDARGKGIATTLLNPLLEQCETQNIPVYLETSNVTNVDIYNHKGFSLTKSCNFGSVDFYFMKK